MRKGWTYRKLGDICEVINGLWTGKKAPFITVAVIRNTNFSKDCRLKLDDVAYLDVETKQYSSRKLKPGDIIIEKSGGSEKQPVGRPVLFDIEEGDYSFSNFTATLRIKEGEIVYPTFLHRCLYGHYVKGETLRMQSKTTGLHNLDMKAFLRLPIPNLPLAEQERIVAELDLLQGIIDKQKAQLKELDALAQSIFYDMFGDPVENEKGWQTLPIGEVGKVITVNTPSTKDENNYSSDDYCFVKPSDIEKEGVSNITDTEYHISKKAYENARKLPTGSVLITCIGIIGKVGVLNINATCNQQINAIIPNTQTILSLYLAFCILGLRNILESMANAPVVPIINKGDFSKIIIPVPPLPLQQSFATKIEAIERQKASINASIAETQKLFDYTMDKYFG